MPQVLRLTGLAVAASIALAFLVVIGFIVAGFVVAEWRPDGSAVGSLIRWLHSESAPAVTTGSPWDNLWAWCLAALVPLLWYLAVWWGWGRDRRIGMAFPRFAPPAGLSPAGVRQILGMGFDGKCVAAEMLSLAVRGHLKIEREPTGLYRMRRRDAPSAELTVAERHLLATLYRGRPSIRLHYADAGHLRVAMEAFRNKLEHELEGPVYETNVWAVALGIAIGGLGFVGATAALPAGVPTGPDLWLAAATLIAIAAVNVLFFRLMKAPTDFGREILDEIGGFRLFLAIAEHERMKTADAPELTAHLFAKYLPFALAMDIELDWAERFSENVQGAIPDALDFEWYADPGRAAHDMGLMGMARALGAATAAVVYGDEADG